MMSLQRNYYEVLGLPPGATTDQIKKKYRELARKFHPDVVQDKTLGQRVFTQINQAYSVLGDPERRAQYNGTLAQNDTLRAAAPAPAAPAANPAPAKAAAMPPRTPAAQPAPRPTVPSQAATSTAADSAAATRKSQAFTEMLGRAENAIMAGKPVEARAFCVRILETDPRQVRALEILGDALAQMGRREEAAVQYRRALEIAPSTMIQAKLKRAAEASPSTRTVPPSAPAANGSSVQRTNPPADSEPEKSGSLLGRLLGRK